MKNLEQIDAGEKQIVKTEPTSLEETRLISVEEEMNELMDLKNVLSEIMHTGSDPRIMEIALIMNGKRHAMAHRIESFALQGGHTVEENTALHNELQAFRKDMNEALHLIDDSSRQPERVLAFLHKLKFENKEE